MDKVSPMKFNDMVQKQREGQLRKDYDEDSDQEYIDVCIKALQQVKQTVENAIDSIKSSERDGYYDLLEFSHLAYFLDGADDEYDWAMDALHKLVDKLEEYIQGWKNGDYI